MAFKITAQLKGTRELKRELRRRGREAPRLLGKGLFQEGERIMRASKGIVSVDQGPLRASGHVQLPIIRGTKVKVILGFGGPSAPYAIVIHEGRPPGSKMPPPDSLEGWAGRHGIPTDRGTLFVLARSIGLKGTEPTKYLEKPFNAAIPGMAGRIAKSLRGGGSAPKGGGGGRQRDPKTGRFL